MYLNRACFIFQIAARDADIRVLRTDLSSAQKKIKNHSNEVTVFCGLICAHFQQIMLYVGKVLFFRKSGNLVYACGFQQ